MCNGSQLCELHNFENPTYSANRYSNDSASLARSDPFYRDSSVNIATSGAREFSPEKRESYSSYDYSPKESGYGSSSVNLR